MQNQLKIQDHKGITTCARIASVLAAGSLAVLVQLFCWEFELRSISRLILQSGLLSVPLWLGLFFLFYRKMHLPIHFNIHAILIGSLSSLVFGFQSVPVQPNNVRYVISIAVTAIMFFIFYLSCIALLFDYMKIPWKDFSLILFLICGLIGMSIVLINSLSVRLYADDFFHAVLSDILGFCTSTFYFSRTWSSRLFSNLLIMRFVKQPNVIFFSLILVLLASFFSLKSMHKNNLFRSCLTALAFSFFIPFTIFSVTPDLYKSLFWISSALTLVPLLIMIPIYLSMMTHFSSSGASASKGLLIFCFLMGVTISITHEAAVLGWLIMHVIGVIWLTVVKSRNIALRTFMLAGCAAALLGLLIIMVIPGGHARAEAQNYQPPSTPITLILQTAQYFLDFLKAIPQAYYDIHTDSKLSWMLLIAALGLGYLSDTSFARTIKSSLIIMMTAIFMSAISFFPGAYVLGSSIPERTQFIPSMYLVLGCFVSGLFLPRFKNSQLSVSFKTLVILLLIFGSLRSINQLWQTIAPMRQFAAEWDLRDAKVRLKGELPYPINIPWDENEQNFHDVRLFYCDFIQDLVDCDTVRKRSNIDPDWFNE